MNERIKELAEQAGMIIGDASNFDMAKFMPKEVKFAELIVKECVEEIKHLRMKYDTHQDVESEEIDWYILDAWLQAEVRLKEHFGVEE